MVITISRDMYVIVGILCGLAIGVLVIFMNKMGKYYEDFANKMISIVPIIFVAIILALSFVLLLTKYEAGSTAPFSVISTDQRIQVVAKGEGYILLKSAGQNLTIKTDYRLIDPENNDFFVNLEINSIFTKTPTGIMQITKKIY